MRLRSLTKHIRDQNWFAVALDFFIVVVGILIAFQITSWSAGRALDVKERELLTELKLEIETDITMATGLSEHFANVHAAAKRSIDFMDSGPDCGNACWPVVADFFHASHWFPVAVKRATFEDMRRQGLPRSREVVSAVDDYLAQNYINALVLDELPAYREDVRSVLPVSIHEAYWSTCWSLNAGVETINYDDCPQGVSNEIAAQAVEAIIQREGLHESLTFWFSEITPTADELENQNASAQIAIAAIEKELGYK